MKSILWKCLLVAIIIAIPDISNGRKIKISHRIGKNAIPENEAYTQASDSLISTENHIGFQDSIARKIRFYGFDKTAGSSIESFFAVNNLPVSVTALEVKITYLDMQGRMLHSRQLTIPSDIPAGATRRIDIKSWDTQKSFYFHQSARPKRQATPFNVIMELTAIRIPVDSDQ